MLSRIWWRGLTRRWGSSGATAAHVPELGELRTMARGKLRLLNLLTSHLEALERDDDQAAPIDVWRFADAVSLTRPNLARIRHFAPASGNLLRKLRVQGRLQ